MEQGAARPRIYHVQVAMGLVALGLVIQLIRVQFGPYAPVFASRMQSTTGLIETVAPARGLIFDRDGVLLATNATMYHLEVEIRQVTPTSQQDIAVALSHLLLLPQKDMERQLKFDRAGDRQYRIRLTRQDAEGKPWPIIIDQVIADVLNGFLKDPKAPDMSGLALVPAPKRVYPNGTMAGHVLGFVNQEGKGFFGVEGFYDDWLAGKPITVSKTDIPPEARLQPDPPAGVNVVLTLDAEVQEMVETALKDSVEYSMAEGGQAIVTDPHTGEILAMASYPPLDPNSYQSWFTEDEGNLEKSGEEVITPAVAGLFEPGSTFKVLTMAAALDSGSISADEVFIDTGEIEVGGNTIRNWDNKAWGPQTMVGCLRYSLNVCLAHVASQEVGGGTFYAYMNAFGIGQLTGVDMASEIPGQLRTPRHPEWTESDLGTNAFGQGVSVTPIQLLAAVSAVANDGVMIQPHIVRQIVGPQGVYWPKPTVLGHPISADTAHTLTEMLVQSLEGETRFAGLEGYRVAGKTGTAQVPTELGYDPHWTIASFIGWGPVDDPKFMVFVRLDKPALSPWGAVVAAPLFHEIASRMVVLMEIPPAQSQAGSTTG